MTRKQVDSKGSGGDVGLSVYCRGTSSGKHIPKAFTQPTRSTFCRFLRTLVGFANRDGGTGILLRFRRLLLISVFRACSSPQISYTLLGQHCERDNSKVLSEPNG